MSHAIDTVDDIGYPGRLDDESVTIKDFIELKKQLIAYKQEIGALNKVISAVGKQVEDFKGAHQALSGNCNYLYEQFQIITQDHSAMLTNCQKMIACITMVTEFMNAYRPILNIVQEYHDSLNPPKEG